MCLTENINLHKLKRVLSHKLPVILYLSQQGCVQVTWSREYALPYLNRRVREETYWNRMK